MDVVGLRWTAPAGECFRADWWEWLCIWHLVRQTCADLLGADLLKEMAAYGGAGPEDQAVCTAMADRLESWLADHAGGLRLQGVPTAETAGQAAAAATEAAKPVGYFLPETRDGVTVFVPGGPLDDLLRVPDARLKEFVAFLRHCGGFALT
jgi:hypothetical protein